MNIDKKTTQIFIKLKKLDKRTPSKRHIQRIKYLKGLNKNNFLKSKVNFIKKKLGHGTNKHIICRFRQAGSKKLYRNIENIRLPKLHYGLVEAFEYNPTHTALLARIYNDTLNYHFYIRAPLELELGSTIYTSYKSEIEGIGYCGKLLNIRIGSRIHNININNCNSIARSAGSFGIILEKYLNYCLVKFPSLKLYYVPASSQATIGSLSKTLHNLTILGSAGINRLKGRRPHVRGVAMNPIDHPHGGGEGKTSGGKSTSVSLWGKPTKNIKKKKKLSYSKNRKSLKITEKIESQRRLDNKIMNLQIVSKNINNNNNIW